MTLRLPLAKLCMRPLSWPVHGVQELHAFRLPLRSLLGVIGSGAYPIESLLDKTLGVLSMAVFSAFAYDIVCKACGTPHVFARSAKMRH
jgi:hypothetical protein